MTAMLANANTAAPGILGNFLFQNMIELTAKNSHFATCRKPGD